MTNTRRLAIRYCATAHNYAIGGWGESIGGGGILQEVGAYHSLKLKLGVVDAIAFLQLVNMIGLVHR
jgi:hypothetical protein